MLGVYCMAIYENIEVQGLVEQKEALEKLMVNNPGMEKKVQGLVRKALQIARKELSQSSRQMMLSDPRGAYKAVRTAIYKRILGGNVNILNKKTAGATAPYLKARTLRVGQRGGNRLPVSSRTQQIDSYRGSDRGFILRFLNAGTDGRETRFGNRERIRPRNFFASNSTQAMKHASEELERLLDELIKKEL